MSPLAAIKERTQRDDINWELLFLERQAAQLQRERKHLSSKAEERPLSIWEQSRCDEIFDELSNLLGNIISLKKTQDYSH